MIALLSLALALSPSAAWVVSPWAARNAGAALAAKPPMRMALKSAPEDTVVAIAGATGYIGKYVVKECVDRGYQTLAVTRKADSTFAGAETVVADVCETASLSANVFAGRKVDVVISCLASRSGTKSDSWAIDYQATLNCLEAAKAAGVKHFILLSAFCVRKPLLQFQHAKLKFEDALMKAGAAGELDYSIVRPTAFFKSVSGQLEVVQGGFPFVVFGDGTMCRCNPISEGDLATYIVSCISDPAKTNKALDLGGPDEGYTMEQQGRLLAEACGKEPNIVKAPVALFDAIIGGLDFLGKFAEPLADAAELARIGKYYAVEDMLTTKPEEKFGTLTLKQHYEKIAREGQEYDPYTSVFGSSKSKTAA